MDRFAYVTLARQKIVQRGDDFRPLQAEQDVYARRLDVRIDHTDSVTHLGQLGCHVRSRIGFARTAAKGMYGYDFAHNLVLIVSSNLHHDGSLPLVPNIALRSLALSRRFWK